MKRAVIYENINEMPFLSMVMNEALRMEPPVGNGSASTLSQDCKIGKYHVKAGDQVQINIHGMHHSSAHWQRPHEFLPERWDSSNKLSLAPNG